VRLIQKWLNAGVLEDDKHIRSEVGSPQGTSFSPLAANIYLHYVFDLWAHQWRQRYCRGDVRVVRYVDDIMVGFEKREEAEQFQEALRQRFAKFGLIEYRDPYTLCQPPLLFNNERLPTSLHRDPERGSYYLQHTDTAYYIPELTFYFWGTGTPLSLRTAVDLSGEVRSATVTIVDLTWH
jgi:hypothetical protein